jgi:hypothetical protein
LRICAKLTYNKTITMENEDIDFQFYDRFLTKILQGTEGRSVRHSHIDFLTRRKSSCCLLYTDWAKLFKSEKYLNAPIEEYYKVNAAALNFNPTEWLDLYNHSDPKGFTRKRKFWGKKRVKTRYRCELIINAACSVLLSGWPLLRVGKVARSEAITTKRWPLPKFT